MNTEKKYAFRDSVMSDNMSESDKKRYGTLKSKMQSMFNFKDGENQVPPEITFEDTSDLSGKIDKNLPKTIHINFKDYIEKYFSVDSEHIQNGLITDVYITPSGTNFGAFDSVNIRGFDHAGQPMSLGLYEYGQFGNYGGVSDDVRKAEFSNLGLVDKITGEIRREDAKMTNNGKVTIPDLRDVDLMYLNNDIIESTDLVFTGQLKNSGLEYYNNSSKESPEDAQILRGLCNYYLMGGMLDEDSINAVKDATKSINSNNTVKDATKSINSNNTVKDATKSINSNNIVKSSNPDDYKVNATNTRRIGHSNKNVDVKKVLNSGTTIKNMQNENASVVDFD